MSATPARLAALDVLRDVRAGTLIDRALDNTASSLDRRERAWVQELTYGVVRLRARLDYALAELVRGSIRRIEPDVLIVLRLGAYQIVAMDGVPVYAAVSQSVDLARHASGEGAARLVNAVLHRLARDGISESAYPPFESDPPGYLETWGSHPRWLVERWIERWGVDAARRLVEANNERPDAYLRVVGMSAAQAVRRLADAGIAASSIDMLEDALRLNSTSDTLAALATLPAYAQDPAAGLVALYAAPAPGDRILDLTAAPGGKTIALATGPFRPGGAVDQSAQTGALRTPSHALRPGLTIGMDIALARARLIAENATRVAARTHTQLTQVAVVNGDARRPPFRKHAADLVLLDAPCTGTGTLRRHPDGRWRLEKEDVGTLAALQRTLLRAAAPLVRSGGVLVYATCSLEIEENELQVRAFLEDWPDFVTEPGPLSGEYLDDAGWLSVDPQSHGHDGAFAARLRRR